MDVWLETVVYVFNGSKVLIFSDVVFRILFELGEQAQLKKCRALEVDAACEGRVLDGSNFRLVALFVLCFVTILLHDFFHDCNEDRVYVDSEGFELSFHNKKVAFDSNSKYWNWLWKMRISMQRREAELEVCYCSVYFVLSLLLYVL